MRMFVPITKVDAVKREVWGRMVQEVVDSSGEIFDYAGSKEYFEAWTQKFSDATEGKSLGNVRAMHQPISAGKIIKMDFLDTDLAIDIGTKIVDDKEWEKVEEGVYTGFSIGGDYVKRWSDGTHKRYIANPKEVSLVDSPAVPTAMFSMIKADGTIEKRSFKMTTENHQAAVDVLADMLNKGEITPQRLIELAKADKPAAAVVPPTREEMVKFLSARPNTDVEWVAKLSDEELAKKHSEAIAADKVEAEKTIVAEALKNTVAAEHNRRIENLARDLCKADGQDPDEKWMGYAAKATRELENADEAARLKKADADKVQAHNERIALKARELCKAAKDGKDDAWQDFVADAIREIKKADAAKPAPVTAAASGPAPAAVTEQKPGAAAEKTDKPGELKKGLWDVQRLADVLISLAYCAMDAESEAMWEGDQSIVPAQLRDAAKAVGQALKDMTVEEVDELCNSMGGVGTAVLYMADSIGDLVKVGKITPDGLKKAGARHSKTDLDRVQSIHKAIVELGAECAKDDDGGDIENADAGGKLKKALAGLSKVEQLEKTVAELTERLKKVEDMPAPVKGTLRVVGKDDDAAGGGATPVTKVESTPGQHNPAAAEALIKQELAAKGGLRKV